MDFFMIMVMVVVASLSERAERERRVGVSVIVSVGYFFLFGGDDQATQLIKYETSLPPKIEDNNVKGFSCYHTGDYKNLDDPRKKDLLSQSEEAA
jgi:hypothetical protein